MAPDRMASYRGLLMHKGDCIFRLDSDLGKDPVAVDLSWQIGYNSVKLDVKLRREGRGWTC